MLKNILFSFLFSAAALLCGANLEYINGKNFQLKLHDYLLLHYDPVNSGNVDYKVGEGTVVRESKNEFVRRWSSEKGVVTRTVHTSPDSVNFTMEFDTNNTNPAYTYLHMPAIVMDLPVGTFHTLEA